MVEVVRGSTTLHPMFPLAFQLAISIARQPATSGCGTLLHEVLHMRLVLDPKLVDLVGEEPPLQRLQVGAREG